MTNNIGMRDLKRMIHQIIHSNQWPSNKDDLLKLPLQRIVNPVFGLLTSSDAQIHFRAVSAMGVIVQAIADQDMERARVVMRRLMWSLNDESGGIGWGAPEAMAEIMYQSERLAREFAPVFISYLNPDGNYIEYEPLQRGLLWGVLRVLSAFPTLFRNVSDYIGPYLQSPDPVVRAYAVLITKSLRSEIADEHLVALRNDLSTVEIHINNDSVSTRIKDLLM
jgi:hypothetical protein